MKATHILSPKEILEAISSKLNKGLLVTCLDTGKILEFSSHKEAAAFIKCNRESIIVALKRDPSIIKNKYLLKRKTPNLRI